MQIKLIATPIVLTILALVIFSFTAERLQKQPLSGKGIYEKYCSRCHGATGEKTRATIKSLKLSTQPDFEIINIITTGKAKMPAFKGKLTPKNIELVRDYIKTLRK